MERGCFLHVICKSERLWETIGDQETVWKAAYISIKYRVRVRDYERLKRLSVTKRLYIKLHCYRIKKIMCSIYSNIMM